LGLFLESLKELGVRQYAIVVFFGNFLDLKIIFGEMFLKHGIYDKIFFFQKICAI
jgi:hypothetical protein